jgi:hypothetical protein
MKTNRSNSLSRYLGLTIGLAMLAGVAGNINAQNGAKGGAAKLQERSGRAITTTEIASPIAMSCPKCKNDVVQVRDSASKGGGRVLVTGAPLTDSVARHACERCTTDWSVVGHGKAKVSVATHKCTATSNEAVACSTTNKPAPATAKGADKKLEVAPLK